MALREVGRTDHAWYPRVCLVETRSADRRFGPVEQFARMATVGQNQPFTKTCMTNLSPEEPISSLESFYSDFDWYVGHARSLAMSPEDCCTDQGNYLVAAELFYFLLKPTQLIDDPLGKVTAEQKLAVERLRDSIRLVPLEARSGGPTAAASLADMRQPSWELPRRLANELLAVLAPLAIARDAFYAKETPYQSL